MGKLFFFSALWWVFAYNLASCDCGVGEFSFLQSLYLVVGFPILALWWLAKFLKGV
jgi:hypothetical protein